MAALSVRAGVPNTCREHSTPTLASLTFCLPPSPPVPRVAQTVRMILDLCVQYKALLQDAGFAASGAAANRASDLWPVVQAVLVAGLYPEVARIDPKRRRCRVFTNVGGTRRSRSE